MHGQLLECIDGLAELRKALADNDQKNTAGRETELSEMVRKVEERLVSLKTAVEVEVKPELANIASITAKEQHEMQNMRQQNTALKLMVDQLLAAQNAAGPRGSLVGMTRCLFCSDSGNPKETNAIMGSDGKMYKTQARPQSQPELAARGHHRARTREQGGAGAPMRRFRQENTLSHGASWPEIVGKAPVAGIVDPPGWRRLRR